MPASAFNIVSWEQGEPVEAYPMSSFLTDLALPEEGDQELLKAASELALRRYSFEDRPSSSAESSLDDDDDDFFAYDDLLDAAADLWDGGRGDTGSASPDSFTLGYHFDDVRPSTKSVSSASALLTVPSFDANKGAAGASTSPALRSRSSVQSFAEAFAPKREARSSRSISPAQSKTTGANARRCSDSGASAADDEHEEERPGVSPISPSFTDKSDLYEAGEAPSSPDRPRRSLLRPASIMARSATSPVPSTPGSVYSCLSPLPQQLRPLPTPAPLDDDGGDDDAETARSHRLSVLFREVESLALAGAPANPRPIPAQTSMTRSLSLATASTPSQRHTYVRSSTVREAVPHRRPRFQPPSMTASASTTSVALERSSSKRNRLSSRFVALRKSLPSLAAARAAAEAQQDSRPRLTSDMISAPVRSDDHEVQSETEVDARSQPMSEELLAILSGQNGGDLWDDESDEEDEDEQLGESE